MYMSDTVLELDAGQSVLQTSTTKYTSGGESKAEVTSTTVIDAGRVGSPYYVLVQLRSTTGIDLTISPESSWLTYTKASSIQVTVSPVAGKGRYELALTTSSIGSWSVFNIKVNGMAIKLDNFIWKVTLSDINGPQSYISGTGTQTAKVGVASTFSIFARDVYGNNVPYKAANGAPIWLVELIPDDPNDAIFGTVAPFAEDSNQHICTYSPQVAGFAELRVYVNDVAVGSTIPIVELANGVLDTSKIVYSPTLENFLDTFGVPKAGTMYSITIYSFDSYNNPYTSPSLGFSLRYTPSFELSSLGVTTKMFTSTKGDTANENIIEWGIQTAGQYTSNLFETTAEPDVSVNSDTGLVISVIGNIPSPSRSKSQGSGITGGNADAENAVSFTVLYYDEYGNPTSMGAVYSDGSAISNPQISIVVNDFDGNSFTLIEDKIVNGGDVTKVYRDAVYTVYYTPYTPGTYSIEVQVLTESGFETIGEGNAAEVYFAPVAPPTLTLAKMTDDLGEIRVTFTEATDQGGMTSKQPCTAVLADVTIAKCAADVSTVTCSWSTTDTEFSYLIIKLGAGATILPKMSSYTGDFIQLKDNAIKNAAQTSYAMTGSIQLTIPDNPISPVAVLDMPSSVGLCDDVHLSAAASSGGGTRSLSYSYTITSTNGDTSSAVAQIASQNPNGASVDIYLAADYLSGGATYVFTMTAKNFLDKSSSTSVSLFKSTSSIPLVTISGPSELSVFPSDIVDIDSVGQQPTQCSTSAASTSNSLTYTWTQVDGPVLDFSAITGETSPSLSIPENTLKYGYAYILSVEVKILDITAGGKSSSDTVTINVIPSEISVTNALGSNREANRALDLVLTANPSDTMSVSFPWNYAWDCEGRCMGDLDSCLLESQFTESCGFTSAIKELFYENAASITLPAGAAAPEYTYRFSCLISREPVSDIRALSDYVHVSFPDGVVVDVAITTSGNLQLINEEDALSMTCASANYASVTYLWSIKEGDIVSSEGLIGMVQTVKGVRSITSSVIYLQAGILTANQDYVFRCTVNEAYANGTEVAQGGASGSAEYFIYINDPPAGGSMKIKATSTVDEGQPIDVDGSSKIDIDLDGIVDYLDGSNILDGGFQTLLTKFTIEALGWVDEYTPLSYTFIYSTCPNSPNCECPSTCTYEVAVALQSSNSATAFLPEGTVYVGVFVYDYAFAESVFWYSHPLLINPVDTALLSSLTDTSSTTEAVRVDYAPAHRRLLSSLLSTDKRGRRLQESAIASAARQLKELVYDISVGAQNFHESMQFIDSWGRSYGRYLAEYEINSATCNGADPDLATLKMDIIEEFKTLAESLRITSSSMQQSVCAITKLTWTPGELSNQTQQLLTTFFYENVLLKVVGSWHIITSTNQNPLVVDAAGECFFDFVNLMMRQTAAACYSETSPRERFQPRMSMLYNMAYSLGTQLAREAIVGSDPQVYLGQYLSIAFQREQLDLSSTAQYDLEGVIQDEEQITEFEWKVNLIDTIGCVNSTGNVDTELETSLNDASLRCGSSVTKDDVIETAGIAYYGPITADDTDYINPLPSSGTQDDRAFGSIVGLSISLQHSRYQASSEELLAMTSPEKKQFIRSLSFVDILTVGGVLSIRPYALPDQYNDEEYVVGIRYWNNRTGDDGVFGWDDFGVNRLQGSSAEIDIVVPSYPFTQYAEEKPPSPPPPPPLLTPPPPIPEIFGAPLPPPMLENDGELDMGIISGPVVAGIALCSYVIYVFARRRRLLQEMHIDYDELIDEKGIPEE